MCQHLVFYNIYNSHSQQGAWYVSIPLLFPWGNIQLAFYSLFPPVQTFATRTWSWYFHGGESLSFPACLKSKKFHSNDFFPKKLLFLCRCFLGPFKSRTNHYPLLFIFIIFTSYYPLSFILHNSFIVTIFNQSLLMGEI